MKPHAYLLLLLTLLFGCDLGRITVGTTAKVLRRAQPSLQMESDYELAARAIPGALKTVEGFWIVSPNDENLIAILTEGYCQYGTAFVEDEWEQAEFSGNFEGRAYHNDRATKMFARCLNYALMSLGERFQKEIFEADAEGIERLVKSVDEDARTPLMWAGIALASVVNHNMGPEAAVHLPTAKRLLERVIELDGKHAPHEKAHAALPHIALGMIYSALPVPLGGSPDRAGAAFAKAVEITEGKYLLPHVLWGYRVGKQTQNRALFREHMMKVLSTPPSIWPEQRLANEVAHRKARRYLTKEMELFR